MKIWLYANDLLDIIHAKVGTQGFAFIVGAIFSFLKNLKILLYMIDIEALVNVAVSSLVSGGIYALISLGKDLLNKYYFKIEKTKHEDIEH